MDKKRTFDGFAPSREAAVLGNYNDIPLLNKGKGEFSDLTENLSKGLYNESLSEGETPVCCFVLHDAKDGEYAAKVLEDDLAAKNYSVYVIDFSPSKNDPCPHVKRNSLIRVAKEQRLWESKPLFKEFTFAALAFLVPIIFTVLSLILENPAARQAIFTTLILVSAISFAIVLGVILKRVVKNRSESFNVLITMLYDYSMHKREVYDDFIYQLSALDYDVSSFLFSSFSKEVCIIKNLNSLTDSQRFVLSNYLSCMVQKQYWIMFAEYEGIIEDFIDSQITNCTKKKYYIKPLSLEEKRELAESIGLSKDFTPTPVIKRYGVDYIINSYYRRQEARELTELLERVNAFCELQKYNGFTANIETLIYLIADLQCNYLGEMRNLLWENLFNISNIDKSPINVLDTRLCAELFFQNIGEQNISQLSRLIQPIFNEFRDDLKDILICKPLRSRALTGTAYKQLLLIKAIRCTLNVTEDRCLAINDEISYIIKSEQTEDNSQWFLLFQDEDWATIFLSILRIYEENGMYWFAPFLLHSILEIFKYRALKERPIFSTSEVLDFSRTNTLLNMDEDYDAIKDHYEIVKLAFLEISNSAKSVSKTKYPISFGLLQLTNAERLEYYKYLTALNETLILSYYDSLFDVFCTSVMDTLQQCTKMFSPDVAINDLYEKYSRRASRLSVRLIGSDRYILPIFQDILNIIQRNCSTNNFILGIIDKFKAQIANQDDQKRNQNIVLLSAECDAYESATFMFLSAILSNVLGTSEVVQNSYLGIGNDILRVLFLLFYERNRNLFNDDMKYLVDILVRYKEPSNAILGYMLSLSTYLLPEIVKSQLLTYINNYKSTIIAALKLMSQTIKIGSVEPFIHALYRLSSNVVQKEDYDIIFRLLKSHMDSAFPSSPAYKLGCQLISVLVDNKVDSSLDGVATDEIAKQMLEYTPNTIYLLYSKYIDIDKSRFLSMLPQLTSKLLESSYTSNYLRIVEYLADESTPKDDSAYNETMDVFLQNLSHNLPIDLITIDSSISVLNQQIDFPTNINRKSRIAITVHALLEQREQTIYIETQSYFRKKVWGHYGILQYSLFLIMSDHFHANEFPDDYTEVSDADKISYLSSNAMSIKPTFLKGTSTVYNIAYLDLLKAIIENINDIQKSIAAVENQLLIHFANDAIEIIETVFLGKDSPIKRQICDMLLTYISRMKKREKSDNH